MIITTDSDKSTEASNSMMEIKEREQREPPPTYGSIEHSSSSSPPALAISPQPSIPVPSNMVNYFSISRIHGNIKETLAINPSLYIPNNLAPPLSDGETRKNVSLDAVHGRIQADITLVEPSAVYKPEKKQATMQFSSVHGGIKLRIHDHPYRPPISLSAKSQNGDIKLCLPSSFHGPISLSYQHGEIKRSSALNKNLVTFSERGGLAQCFLGDFSKYVEREGKGWNGDELVAEVIHGDVKLEYDDDSTSNSSLEENVPASFVKRLFGHFA